ncbi:MAG: nitroreductase [Burkholderiaceae bacterium]
MSAGDDDLYDDWLELTEAVIHSRRHRSAKRLNEPGPSADELARIVAAASAAPDHGRITPWRFMLIPAAARQALGELFARALLERDPKADAGAVATARQKADRGAVLMLALARVDAGESTVPARERLFSLGCAVQNMLLTAHAMGYGTGLLSGKAMDSDALAQGLSLAEGEQPVCFIVIGTPNSDPKPQGRPSPADYYSVWPGVSLD